MASRTWILASLAVAMALPAACQSVDVDMPEPKYASRAEDLPAGPVEGDGWEQRRDNAGRGSIRIVPAKPRFATRIEEAEAGAAPGPVRQERAAANADSSARPAVAAPADPVVRREPIRTEELPPLSVADQPPERGLESAPARRSPEPRPETAPPPARPTASVPATPAATASAPAPTPAGPGYRYVVQPGDTVAGVGRRFGVRAQTIIELNGLTPQGGVRAGQALTLPSSARDRGSDPYATGPAPSGMSRSQDEGSAPAPVAAPAPPVRTAAPSPQTATPAATPAAVATRGRGRFIWPLRGEILSRFGSAGTGLRNDGINIAAPEGTSVKAAAAGEVVYAGSVIQAFGNMVLIKHPDGWVTAYGHLGRIDVRMRDQVTQGQIIGAVGSSGGVPTPQLHFEIRFAPSAREKAAPVDPMPILR